MLIYHVTVVNKSSQMYEVKPSPGDKGFRGCLLITLLQKHFNTLSALTSLETTLK